MTGRPEDGAAGTVRVTDPVAPRGSLASAGGTTSAPADAASRPAGRPASPTLLRLVTVLVVVGSVGWRRGEYFSGSLDPVVLSKALLSLLALAMALLLAQRGPRRSLGTGSLWWLGLLLGGSVLGAVTAGNTVAGGVVAVRVAILATTVFLLLRAAPAAQVVTGLAWACGSLTAVASLTGWSSYTDEGRLAGGIPAVDPNDLALLAGVAVVVLVWRLVHDQVGVLSVLAVLFQLGVIWATGSRTGLLMLVLACLVMAVHIRRPRVGLVVSGLVLGAVAAVAIAATGAVSGFAERGGDGASTLDSRFIAWRASLTWAETAWQQVFGGGLSVKIIRVPGQYWDTQPLDSSWFSLLVQTGVLGVVAAAAWVLWALSGTLRAPRSHRILFLGLLLFLLGRSVLESGLFDATPAFLAFFTVSVLAEGGSRARLRAEAAVAGDARPVPAPRAGLR